MVQWNTGKNIQNFSGVLKILGVSRSGYLSRKKRFPSDRAQRKSGSSPARSDCSVVHLATICDFQQFIWLRWVICIYIKKITRGDPEVVTDVKEGRHWRIIFAVFDAVYIIGVWPDRRAEKIKSTKSVEWPVANKSTTQSTRHYRYYFLHIYQEVFISLFFILKESKQSDFNGSEQFGPFWHIISEKLTHNLIEYSLLVGYNIDGW